MYHLRRNLHISLLATLIEHQFTIYHSPLIPVTHKLYTQSGRGLRKRYFLSEISEKDIADKGSLQRLLEYLINGSEQKDQNCPVFLKIGNSV